MELPDALAVLFRQPIIVLDGKALSRSPWREVAVPTATMINEMGVRSAIAQGLRGASGGPAPVTSVSHLTGSSHRLFLLSQEGDQGKPVLVGLLKVGPKDLFHYTAKGEMRELRAQFCVLDFYVHEDWQRRGAGLMLFASVLQTEGKVAHEVAYDVRASPHAARARGQLARSPVPTLSSPPPAS